MAVLAFDPGEDEAVRVRTGKARDRLVAAAIISFQSQGYHASGVSTILDRAGLPKGSMYHHFPGGKQQLAISAVEALTDTICGAMDAARARGISAGIFLARVAVDTGAWLEERKWRQGALLSVLAQEVVPAVPDVAAAVGAAYDLLVGKLGDWLLETAAPGALPRHAALTMARSAWGLLDGAVAQSRALQSQEPMLAAARVLPVLLRAGASLDRPAPRD
ncbi:MAG: TetR/AcrR family transcriptional regulator [Notoacmeibacter sp.]|nr:TetR/AcrR family transcriptional regulator [Notoacmeibacter sp.]